MYIIASIQSVSCCKLLLLTLLELNQDCSVFQFALVWNNCKKKKEKTPKDV